MILLFIAAGFFVWRHVVGQIPFGSDATLNALFDKWHLGPLRLLNFAVLALIAVRCRRTLAAWAAHSPIATMGRTSLVVFSAQLVICLAVLALVGDAARPHLSVFEAALVVGALLALYGVARASLDGGGFLRGHRRALAARVSARAAR